MGSASMQTPMAARCREAKHAVKTMCSRGRLEPVKEVSAGTIQAKAIKAMEPVAIPVNSALKRLHGVVLDNHQFPWVSVAIDNMAPNWAARKPIS